MVSTRRDWLVPGLTVAAVVLAVIVAVIVYRAVGDPKVGAVGHAPSSISPSAVPQPYVCWNGEGAPSLAVCPDPAGMKGLDWVLPGHASAVKLGGCTPQPAGPRDLVVECSLTWHDRQVYLDYAYWGSWVDGEDRYEQGGATPLVQQRSDGGTSLFWRARKIDLEHGRSSWRTAEMIRGKGWAASAYAPDQATAEAAMERFGRIRDLRQWRGLPR